MLAGVGAGLCLGSWACAARPGAPVEPRSSAAPRLPPSALAGAVHALEQLAASQPVDALVQVRALEASTLELHSAPAGRVRVYLHLTVYAETGARARAAFDGLRAALELDARRPLASEPVTTERARAVLGAPGWTPAGGEELLSYSDALRLEYTPASASLGTRRARVSVPLAGALPTNVGIEDYVHAAAAAEGLAELELQLRPGAAIPGVDEMRCFLRDQGLAGHGRAELGAFLATLENESPAARVTEVLLEHAPNAPDPHDARAWALEALLVVRVPADG